MTEAERRAANRRRVATGLSDDTVPPYMTGAEIVALKKIGLRRSGNKGATERKGGWRNQESKGRWFG